jgi:hypothetical protein
MWIWAIRGEVVCLEEVAERKKVASVCERVFGDLDSWAVRRQVIGNMGFRPGGGGYSVQIDGGKTMMVVTRRSGWNPRSTQEQANEAFHH